ncbi:class I SAM-dependent methyltransferase [Hyphomonas sp.]|uniref:class I SAM-dependent methyltransferase n=1 Tax=Hyphomonas sp. TaxID=87 RepID=UPI003D2672F0
MNPKLQTRVQRYGWDKAASFYNDGWRDSLEPARICLLNMADAQLGEHVLDVACGTGLVTLPLADAVGPGGRVIATDLSERMVDFLQQEADVLGYKNIRAFRSDAERLTGIRDETFDLVSCALGLMYCPNPTAAIAEAYRVLKPGGRAVFAVWGARKNCGWADIFPIVDAHVNSDVCPLFFRLGTGESLPHEMSLGGFQAVDMERLQTRLSYKDDQKALEAAFLGGPVAMAYARFDQETKKAVDAAYLASIEPYASRPGYEIPGEFVVCSGKKP